MPFSSEYELGYPAANPSPSPNPSPKGHFAPPIYGGGLPSSARSHSYGMSTSQGGGALRWFVSA